MEKKQFREILSSAGNAMITVMVGGAAVAAGALMLAKSGQQRGEMYADINQNTLIEYAMLDLKTHLALEKNCKAALDSGFSAVGPYSVGDDLGGGVTIETIRDQNPGERQKRILIVFKKSKGSGDNQTFSRRRDGLSLQTFNVPDPSDPTGQSQMETCSSNEVAGVEGGMEEFCNSIGGVYDSAGGSCDPNFENSAGFKEDVSELACEVLGGDFTGETCSGININGNILSNHFKLDRILLGGSERTGSIDGQCSTSQVGRGISSDGSLECADITCPQPGSSTYSPRVEGGELYCECQRDRGSDFACGEVNPNSCEDYEVDDGCGTGGKCIIKKKEKECPPLPSCDPDGARNVYSTEGCDYFCGQVPKCEGGPTGGSCTNGTTRRGGLCCLQRNPTNGHCTEPGTAQETCVNGTWTQTSCQ